MRKLFKRLTVLIFFFGFTLSGQIYPDERTVPGKADSRVTQDNIHQTICNTRYSKRGSWSKTMRPPVKWTNALKRRYMKEGNLPGRMKDYELDHYLSISAGGCPDCEDNLRLEWWPEAHLKDRVEEFAYHQICSDQLTLAEGQAMVLDWRHAKIR